MRQGRSGIRHAIGAVRKAARGAIVLKINPNPRRRLPLWREAGRRLKKKKNPSTFS